MFYHIQISYFCSKTQKQVLLAETNITDIEDMRKRIVNPYIFGHSFKFQGIDVILASIHSLKIYESEDAITTETINNTIDSIKHKLFDVTQDIINSK